MYKSQQGHFPVDRQHGLPRAVQVLPHQAGKTGQVIIGQVNFLRLDEVLNEPQRIKDKMRVHLRFQGFQLHTRQTLVEGLLCGKLLLCFVEAANHRKNYRA